MRETIGIKNESILVFLLFALFIDLFILCPEADPHAQHDQFASASSIDHM
jgi:hypothetical protein